MAFVSIGQKYGFVSAGDEFRKELAEARIKTQAEEQAKAQKQLADAQARAEFERNKDRADTLAILRKMGLSEEKIADAFAELDALQKKRREQA